MENRVILIGEVVHLGETKILSHGKSFDFILRTWSKMPNGEIINQYHPVVVSGDQLDRVRPLLELNKLLKIEGLLVHYVFGGNNGRPKMRRSAVRCMMVREAAFDIPPIPITDTEKFRD